MEVELTKGRFAIVDGEDYERITKYKWSYGTGGYACRNVKENGRQRIERMHRFVLNAPKGFDVDHINGDKLDNRRINLRLVTEAQNSYNRLKNTVGSSRYKGVSWKKPNKKWMAKIGFQKKIIYLGIFQTEEEAAIAYNIAAISYFGEYAKLNEIEVVA